MIPKNARCPCSCSSPMLTPDSRAFPQTSSFVSPQSRPGPGQQNRDASWLRSRSSMADGHSCRLLSCTPTASSSCASSCRQERERRRGSRQQSPTRASRSGGHADASSMTGLSSPQRRPAGRAAETSAWLRGRAAACVACRPPKRLRKPLCRTK